MPRTPAEVAGGFFRIAGNQRQSAHAAGRKCGHCGGGVGPQLVGKSQGSQELCILCQKDDGQPAFNEPGHFPGAYIGVDAVFGKIFFVP